MRGAYAPLRASGWPLVGPRANDVPARQFGPNAQLCGEYLRNSQVRDSGSRHGGEVTNDRLLLPVRHSAAAVRASGVYGEARTTAVTVPVQERRQAWSSTSESEWEGQRQQPADGAVCARAATAADGPRPGVLRQTRSLHPCQRPRRLHRSHQPDLRPCLPPLRRRCLRRPPVPPPAPASAGAPWPRAVTTPYAGTDRLCAPALAIAVPGLAKFSLARRHSTSTARTPRGRPAARATARRRWPPRRRR